MQISYFDAEIRLLAMNGVGITKAAEQIGCTYVGLQKYAKANGIAFEHASKQQNRERNEAMRAMYVQGITLQAIGEKFGITRERVRQLLRRDGVAPKDGGQQLAVRIKRETKKAATVRRIEAKWGVSYSEWKAYRADRTIHAFEQHRQNAAHRGIPFLLTFSQWLAIWKASGKLHLKGRGKGHYCMSRLSDSGGYEIGNVHIQSCIENSKEAVKVWKGKPEKKNRGVFCLYPGTNTPWRAGSQRNHVGFYATEEEAVAALAAAVADGRIKASTKRGQGKGWTYQPKRSKRNPYFVSVGKKYVGAFPTQELARAAYLEAVGA